MDLEEDLLLIDASIKKELLFLLTKLIKIKKKKKKIKMFLLVEKQKEIT